jgi:hypothetical protein
MIGARAARILEGISAAVSSASAAARVAILTPGQRLARWWSMVLKLLWVFRALSTKTATTAVIGVEAYRAIVEGVRTGDKPPPEIFRICHGEGVGRPLPATTSGTVSPTMCQHAELARRGNKSSRWWTCKRCSSRWERVPLDEKELTPELLEAAATSTAPLTRTLAREIMERDRLFEETLMHDS